MTRIPAIDTLRGLSLFGILVVNVPFFMMPEGSFGTYAVDHFPRWWDRLATFLMHAVFEGKFIMIFSFLFGWGLYTQMTRDAGFKVQYYRRLFGLLVIGLLHAVFLFVGDILVSYAVLGVPLLWVRNWTPSQLVKGAMFFWIVSIICHAGLGALISLEPIAQPANHQALVRLHQSGTFEAIVDNRISELIQLYVITPFFFMPSVFGMFMLGLAAAKSFAEHGLDSAKPLARKVLTIGFWPAVLLNLIYGAVSIWPLVDDVTALTLRAVAVVGLGVVYLALAAVFLSHPKIDQFAKFAGGEGRMSLTMYISESIVMGFLAYSYGLALIGRIGPAAQMMLALAVYALLLALSHFWLKRFKFGPMEWALRSITQLRLLPLR